MEDHISIADDERTDEDNLANDEDASIMGRTQHNTGGRGHLFKRNEMDLSAMMNVEQKNQLLALISNIMDVMQTHIREVFDNIGDGRDKSEIGIDPPKPTWNLIPNPFSHKYAHLYGNKPLVSTSSADSPKDGIKEKTKGPNLEPPTPYVPPSVTRLELPSSYEEASAMSGKKDENEIMTATMNEMKRDVLGYFGKWRHNVLRRAGDITIKGAGNAGNVASQGPTSSAGNARRLGNAPRGRRTRPSGPSPSTLVEESNAALAQVYRPYSTPLASCPREKRALILHSMLLLLLSLENYSTYSRVLLLHIASSLHIPFHVLTQDELRVAQSLSQVVKGISAEEIAQKRAEEGKTARRLKVGLAGLAGAAIIGLTGGLAAPLVAAGIGTVFGGLGLGATAAAGLLGTMAESTVVVGTLFGLYGARATSKMMDSYAKDIQDFALLPLHGSLDKEMVDPKDIPAEDRRLRVTLGISGWLTQKEDLINPWRALGHQNELYALRWETEALMKMGHSLDTVIKSAAWTVAKKEIIARTVFASLMEAFWPIGLLKISKIIDNPWSVGIVRAEKAGQVLGDAIINNVTGERGITLIGYSLGARVIYSCLMYLAEKRAFGCVENVVLMGAPCPSELRVWAAIKSVVAGRVVNVYSNNDYILAFLYRTSSWQYGVAGLEKIQGVRGVENFDASDIVSGHLRYQYLVGSILKKIGWEDIDGNEVAKNEETLALMIDEEKKLDKVRMERGDVDLSELDLNKEAEKLENVVEKKNEIIETTDKNNATVKPENVTPTNKEQVTETANNDQAKGAAKPGK